MTYRTVKKVVRGSPAVDGAGVRLVRVIGHGDVKDFDPFLMLDAFDSTDPDDYIRGFPWHPHRGIETVTYLVRGRIEHGDSLGNKGAITDGSCQWMTAGSGILHQEMPQPAERMLGLQLWINLPAALKMSKPRYRDIGPADVSFAQGEGWKVGIIAGAFGGKKGSRAGDYVDASMLDVELGVGASLDIPVAPGHNAFAYVMEGGLSFGPPSGETEAGAKDALLFAEGDTVRAASRAGKSARFILFSGKPIKEPIAWGGPIVMNTREELETAFRELDEGTFIKA
jgi:redox-sensitive bicupin YhaK (pirin superfamily)